MQVEFQKTGERRYGIIIRRDGLPDLKMNPAPGFDPLMPHDLLHFLVEQELGLQHAIFGQVAAGGTAGTFQYAPSEASNTREDSRARRKTLKRGRKMLKESGDECAQSERATYLCLCDWLSHSTDEKLRVRAREMKLTAEEILAAFPEKEQKSLNTEKRAQIRRRMDELSARWSSLKVNQSLTLEW